MFARGGASLCWPWTQFNLTITVQGRHLGNDNPGDLAFYLKCWPQKQLGTFNKRKAKPWQNTFHFRHTGRGMGFRRLIMICTAAA